MNAGYLRWRGGTAVAAQPDVSLEDPMRRMLLILALVLPPAATVDAQTLSTRDVVELTKAGLAEEVLLALIEVNRSIFPVDRVTLKTLKDAGVPASVIVAMVRSGRELVAAPAVAPPTPAITHDDMVEAERVTTRERELERELERSRDRELERDLERSRAERRSLHYVVPVAVPIYVPVPVQRRERPRPVEPVYWGWDGKLRPDAWKPAEAPKERKDPKGPGGS
ncbi:MAG: hypothetical protein ABIP65_05325 [Vicinamibacterales bacterium]